MTSFRGSRNRGLLAFEKEAGKDDSGMDRTAMGFGTLPSPDLGVDDVFYFNSEPKSIDAYRLFVRKLKGDAIRVDNGGENGIDANVWTGGLNMEGHRGQVASYHNINSR